MPETIFFGEFHAERIGRAVACAVMVEPAWVDATGLM